MALRVTDLLKTTKPMKVSESGRMCFMPTDLWVNMPEGRTRSESKRGRGARDVSEPSESWECACRRLRLRRLLAVLAVPQWRSLILTEPFADEQAEEGEDEVETGEKRRVVEVIRLEYDLVERDDADTEEERRRPGTEKQRRVRSRDQRQEARRHVTSGPRARTHRMTERRRSMRMRSSACRRLPRVHGRLTA